MQLGFKPSETILLPEYICEVVLHPLDQLGLQYRYYSVDDRLVPKWDELPGLVDEQTRAIMMVHYFGQPQDIPAFQSFCNKYKLLLIEDNAHGHGGTFNGQPLGSFGDIGISSPRKQLLTSSGGVLYLHGKTHSPPQKLTSYPVNPFRRGLGQSARRLPGLKGVLRRLLKTEPDFDDPYAFPEIREAYFRADSASANRIADKNWVAHSRKRREAWTAWADYAHRKGLEPLWDEPHPDSSPWALPVYAPDPQARFQALREGWWQGQDWFPWPTLPHLVIQQHPNVVTRWKRLLCFPLHRFPDD